MTSTLTLKGSKSKGWIITLDDKDYYADFPLEHEELVALQEIIKKKIK